MPHAGSKDGCVCFERGLRKSRSSVINCTEEKAGYYLSVLYESALIHPSAYWTAKVTDTVPWKYLWSMALEEGPHGTTQLQRLLYHISKPTFQGFVSFV